MPRLKSTREIVGGINAQLALLRLQLHRIQIGCPHYDLEPGEATARCRECGKIVSLYDFKKKQERLKLEGKKREKDLEETGYYLAGNARVVMPGTGTVPLKGG